MMFLLSLIACLGLKKTPHNPHPTDPMGILDMLDTASKNIHYVGQGACLKKKVYNLYQDKSARLMFFESKIGAVIGLISCSVTTSMNWRSTPNIWRSISKSTMANGVLSGLPKKTVNGNTHVNTANAPHISQKRKRTVAT